MLNDYRIRKVSDIYYEDLPYILHPEQAWRELRPFSPLTRNLPLSYNIPNIGQHYIQPYYHSSKSQGWNDFLADIKNGRTVLVRDLFWGKEISGVMASDSQSKSDVPLLLASRIAEILAKSLKRPVFMPSINSPIAESPGLLPEPLSPSPEPLPLPARIYTTKNPMDDYDAPDMRHGDLTEAELKQQFALTDISARVDPWGLHLLPSIDSLPLGESPSFVRDIPLQRLSRDESANLLFDEFRSLARMFSFYGETKEVVIRMIDHMQTNSGQPFSDPLLDKALKEQIVKDKTSDSTLLRIKKTLRANINWEHKIYPLEDEPLFYEDLRFKVLPKFNMNNIFNGLVISVHDTWATHITLESLQVEGDIYTARVNYRIQDHFGLDNADILNPLYRKARIFRIWFILQRFEQYNYHPFITEMNATIEITGSRYD